MYELYFTITLVINAYSFKVLPRRLGRPVRLLNCVPAINLFLFQNHPQGNMKRKFHN